MKKTKRILAVILAFVLTFLQMSEMTFAAEPTVTGITLSTKTVGAGGGSVTINVSGSGLTSSNWGVDATAYIKGTELERPALKPKVTGISSTGATIVIPQNTTVNSIEYRVVAGVKKNGTVSADVKSTITQEGKKATIALDPVSSVLTNATTIEVTFTENIYLETTNIQKLKQLIFVSDFGNESLNRVELNDSSSISINGKTLIINFKTPLELRANSVINIKEGALKVFSGKVLRTVSWLITYVPTVTGITLSQEIMDYRGGTVVATLKGVHVENIQKSQIEANIFVPEATAPVNIPVTITKEEGKAPVLTFEIPGNKTNITKCYFLQVKIDGIPLHEGTVENSAKKSVVSVLSKGVSDKEQTLGGATITGNNKLEGVGDNRNITVVVSKQLGELKTVMTLYGTNLDSKLTKVRAIDENGVIWPVYDIPE